KTVPAGKIGVFQNLLDQAAREADPDLLASTIYHETSHWLDMQAWGGPGSIGVGAPPASFMGQQYQMDFHKVLETEQRAWSNQVACLKTLGDVARAANFDAIVKEYDSKIALARNVKDPADWAKIQDQHPEWKVKDDAKAFFAVNDLKDIRIQSAQKK